MNEQRAVNLNELNMARLCQNYLMQRKQGNYTNDDMNDVIGFIGELIKEENKQLPAYKIGVLMMCANSPYWQYLKPIVEDIGQQFLPGHKTEILLWTDIPQTQEERLSFLEASRIEEEKKYAAEIFADFDTLSNLKLFPIGGAQWPMATLMRYNHFLSEEETLRQYDYLFYIDVDMRIVNLVGDEILGDGLTAAKHPMYAFHSRFDRPYEANPESTAYIKQSGKVVVENGKPRFEPLYAAGGFQGGRANDFIEAMKIMRKGIEADFNKNYIARWNDESHWNKYLYDHEPSIVLPAAYIYPDSLIKEYYEPLWGRSFTPRIVTLTKPFTLTKEGGDAVKQATEQLRRL